MHLIGVTGLIGSGKNAVSDYIIDKHHYKHIDFGDIVRDFSTSIGKTHKREDLRETRRIFTQKYDLKFFGEQVVKRIKENKWERVVITGIRYPEDIEPIKKKFGHDMILILVEAGERVRFERIVKRNSVRDPKTFTEFMEEESREITLFNFSGVFAYADHRIDNSGTKEDLHKNIDKFMKEYNLD